MSILKERLLKRDRSTDEIRNIMRDNEIVIITKKERKYLDGAIEKGGLGLKSKMPENGECRLDSAGITVLPVGG